MAEIPTDSIFDYHTPLLSVMRWLGLEKPADIDAAPYLVGNGLTDFHLPDAQCRIGVCWASGNHGPQLNERRRMVRLPSFLPLTELPGVRLISLQKGPGSEDIVNFGMESMVFDVMQRVDNFADTADLISHLDLVVSVDSAVCHLAGAMGKPVLMLSPYTRCWRWWNKTSGYPWYERMMIFMQSANGSWASAMRDVTRTVKFRLAGHS